MQPLSYRTDKAHASTRIYVHLGTVFAQAGRKNLADARAGKTHAPQPDQFAALKEKMARASFHDHCALNRDEHEARTGHRGFGSEPGAARGVPTLMPGGALTRALPGTGPRVRELVSQGRRPFRYSARERTSPSVVSRRCISTSHAVGGVLGALSAQMMAAARIGFGRARAGARAWRTGVTPVSLVCDYRVCRWQNIAAPAPRFDFCPASADPRVVAADVAGLGWPPWAPDSRP